MKNFIQTYQSKEPEKVLYTSQEICPVCGIYTPDGGVCTGCLKKYGLYESKKLYFDQEELV